MEEDIRIPEDRIGVAIGPEGKTKRKIMKKTNTKIEIDSGTGDAHIQGEGEDFFKARDIIKAIGRGFSPEKAFKLLEKDYLLDLISIIEYTGKNSSAQKAKRGRIIGRHGLARKEIEEKTNSFISVQGKTVAIIAKADKIQEAVDAVEMLLQGAKHETMESFLSGRQERFKL